MSKNFIGVYNNVFTEEFCKNIIDDFEQQSKNQIISNDVADRQDTFAQLLNYVDPRILDFITEGLIHTVREYIKTYPILEAANLASYGMKIQKTEPYGGGYHKWHYDNAGHDVTTRFIVWTIYLNDIEEGGETEFLYQGVKTKPETGKLLLFPAGFTHTHRGNPPIQQTKYILTGWFNLMPTQ